MACSTCLGHGWSDSASVGDLWLSRAAAGCARSMARSRCMCVVTEQRHRGDTCPKKKYAVIGGVARARVARAASGGGCTAGSSLGAAGSRGATRVGCSRADGYSSSCRRLLELLSPSAAAVGSRAAAGVTASREMHRSEIPASAAERAGAEALGLRTWCVGRACRLPHVWLALDG